MSLRCISKTYDILHGLAYDDIGRVVDIIRSTGICTAPVVNCVGPIVVIEDEDGDEITKVTLDF